MSIFSFSIFSTSDLSFGSKLRVLATATTGRTALLVTLVFLFMLVRILVGNTVAWWGGLVTLVTT